MPPSQIVPSLVDKGIYIASESSFYRILREDGQLKHRGKAKPRTIVKPEPYVATGPNQVWTWDITYLPTSVKGSFYYLYMIMDIFSRKIVGWEIYENQTDELASVVARKAYLSERIGGKDLVLHSDNGSPMKGATMLATLQNLGVAASFSRPSVSNDNPYSEALFRTLKYRLLANKKEPLSNTLIQQYRAVVASDSSRQLAPKTVGLLLGQPTLTVSDLENKITAQKKGLGVGSLPRHMISKELKSGALIVKETEDGGISNHTLNYAWNTCHKGKALAWFKQQLCDDKNKIDWFTESE